ncbi:hypothetical protein N7470_006064 [Penicillium chermesinum]|nr:hypothetical protein N7470_006064 [Penicillium chermesinum]
MPYYYNSGSSSNSNSDPRYFGSGPVADNPNIQQDHNGHMNNAQGFFPEHGQYIKQEGYPQQGGYYANSGSSNQPYPKSSGRSNSSSSGQRTYQVSGTAAAVVGSKTIQSKNGQMSAIRRKN